MSPARTSSRSSRLNSTGRTLAARGRVGIGSWSQPATWGGVSLGSAYADITVVELEGGYAGGEIDPVAVGRWVRERRDAGDPFAPATPPRDDATAETAAGAAAGRGRRRPPRGPLDGVPVT